MEREVVVPTEVVVAGEDGPTITDMAGRCAAAGYGERLSSGYENSDPVEVDGYVMPEWMAEVLGHIGRGKG